MRALFGVIAKLLYSRLSSPWSAWFVDTTSNFTNFGSEQNGDASTVGFVELNPDNESLSPGPHYLRMQVIGASSGGGRYVYTDYIKVVKQ